jgi:glutamate racemase
VDNHINKPIGIFDSGLGGLTVFEEITKLLPNESIIYVGDTARVPYGTKSKSVVIKFSLQIIRFLIKKNVKMIIVACNTASSYALDECKKIFSVPIIGVIDSGIKCALLKTKNKKIGVIGTEATIKSQIYPKLIKQKDKSIKIYSQACPLFVPIIEEGWFDISHRKIINLVAEEYLSPLKKFRIDTLILGCTHYPIIRDIIYDIMGKNVEIISSAKTVAKETKYILEQKKLITTSIANPRYTFYVTDDSNKFISLAKRFIIGKNVILPTKNNTKVIDIEKY